MGDVDVVERKRVEVGREQGIYLGVEKEDQRQNLPR